jgi:hypothetical protein
MPPSTSDDGSEQTIQHVVDDHVWRRQGKIVAAAGNVLRRPIHRNLSNCQLLNLSSAKQLQIS